MIRGFSHAAIVVPDLERARKFYEEMFGFEVWTREEWEIGNAAYDNGVGLVDSAAAGYIMKGPNCCLELWHYSSPEPCGEPKDRGANDYGLRHLCFEVDDVFAEFERLKALGGIVMNPPQRLEGGSTVYCRDPFGNIIELMEAGPHFPSIHDLPLVQPEPYA